MIEQHAKREQPAQRISDQRLIGMVDWPHRGDLRAQFFDHETVKQRCPAKILRLGTAVFVRAGQGCRRGKVELSQLARRARLWIVDPDDDRAARTDKIALHHLRASRRKGKVGIEDIYNRPPALGWRGRRLSDIVAISPPRDLRREIELDCE